MPSSCISGKGKRCHSTHSTASATKNVDIIITEWFVYLIVTEKWDCLKDLEKFGDNSFGRGSVSLAVGFEV